MAKLKTKDYVKATLQGVIVVAGSGVVGAFLEGIVSQLGTDIPVLGISIGTALAAGALTIASSLLLERVDALN